MVAAAHQSSPAADAGGGQHSGGGAMRNNRGAMKNNREAMKNNRGVTRRAVKIGYAHG